MESQGFYGKTHCCDEFISVSTSLHEDYLKYIVYIYLILWISCYISRVCIYTALKRLFIW